MRSLAALSTPFEGGGSVSELKCDSVSLSPVRISLMTRQVGGWGHAHLPTVSWFVLFSR